MTSRPYDRPSCAMAPSRTAQHSRSQTQTPRGMSRANLSSKLPQTTLPQRQGQAQSLRQRRRQPGRQGPAKGAKPGLEAQLLLQRLPKGRRHPEGAPRGGLPHPARASASSRKPLGPQQAALLQVRLLISQSKTRLLPQPLPIWSRSSDLCKRRFGFSLVVQGSAI